MTTKQANINDLIQELKTASDAYYNSDEALMTDAEFDQKIELLRKLDPENSFLKEIGAKPKETTVWPKVKHTSHIGSLNKVNTKEEWMDWASDKIHNTSKPQFALSFKADGSTIVVDYKDGKLVRGSSRGDGQTGDDLTPNILKIQVPQEIPAKGTFSVRGEAILLTDDFNKRFAPKGAKNARNSCNGLVRAQTYDDADMACISFKAFDIIGAPIKDEITKFKLLKKLGFTTVDFWECKDANEVWEKFEEIEIKRDNGKLDYEIDGMVVSVWNKDFAESLGESDGRPKSGVAIKFKPLQKLSKILDISFQVGLTGRISPVATIEPTNIGGVTITRCSLHNIDNMKALGIYIGCKVKLIRANDVIPMITEVLNKKNEVSEDDWKMPSHCPTCNEQLARDGAYLVCGNLNCSGLIYGGLMTWLQVHNIMGIGPSVLRALIDLGVDDIVKLYKAPVETFSKAANSEKTGQKLWDNLHAKSKLRLGRVLTGLNIHALGDTNGTRLETEFKTLEEFQDYMFMDENLLIERISKIEGIATNAVKIAKGLRDNWDLLLELNKVIEIVNLNQAGPLAGSQFCITGELSIPRNDMHELIQSKGGVIKTSVGKGLTYLITNSPDSGTTKNKKAQALGTKIITEAQLMELMK